MKLIKKVGGLLLSLVLLVSLLPIAAFAESSLPAGVPAGYTELTLNWETGYYTNQSGNKPLTDSVAFASTQKFTKADLPNGTIIVFTNISTASNKYWRYRHGTWNGTTNTTDNNAWVTEAGTVTVDDAWWGENTT